MEFSISGAAKELGVSEVTVRRRLATGLLNGRKLRGKWIVSLSVDEQVDQVNEQSDQVDEQSDQVDDQVDEQSDQVQLLTGVVAMMTDQLQAKDQQIAELHRLMAQTALTASTTRPWWQFWK
jgi:Mg2+ and Co2+ transporter CorA